MNYGLIFRLLIVESSASLDNQNWVFLRFFLLFIFFSIILKKNISKEQNFLFILLLFFSWVRIFSRHQNLKSVDITQDNFKLHGRLQSARRELKEYRQHIGKTVDSFIIRIVAFQNSVLIFLRGHDWSQIILQYFYVPGIFVQDSFDGAANLIPLSALVGLRTLFLSHFSSLSFKPKGFS